ncbi:MAG TPA: SpoIIE family protein phosphatase [candidate division Zixibacteria bacterium]|jgi:sigma-B regulation protein RsbU (phosphoserine phosphatase)
MMNVADFEHFRSLLLEREESLSEWLEDGARPGAVETQKVRELMTEIKDALARMERGSFGNCAACDGTVEMHRLEVQPIRQICLDCLSPDERNRLEEELYLASRIHRALLPQEVEQIDGYELAVKSLAAHVVGGDYYDILAPANGGPARVVIADTMGKGLPAGLVMSNLQGALRILAADIESPAKLLSRLNHWLCRNIPVSHFVSMAIVALQPGERSAHTLVHASAGHCPSILARTDGSVELLDSTGTVIGVHEDFTHIEEHYPMSPGDLLVLYTDGVTEAVNPHGGMFGDDRLADFVRAHRDRPTVELIETLADEVLSFSDRPDFEDDFTVIALRKTL